MHISDGVLAAPVLIGGSALAVAGVGIGLRKLDYDRIPQVAALSAAFFVASSIHVPIGPSSLHLILNGLVGLVLGWVAFPALLVALFLQAVLLQHGGLTTLGVNTFNMAAPAVLVFYLFNAGARSRSASVALAAAFAAGFAGVFLAGAFTWVSLVGSHESLTEAAAALFLAHVPVMVVEGCVAASVVGFLRKTRPDILEAPLAEGPAHA